MMEKFNLSGKIYNVTIGPPEIFPRNWQSGSQFADGKTAFILCEQIYLLVN